MIQGTQATNQGFGTKTIRYCNYSWFCRKYCGVATCREHKPWAKTADCLLVKPMKHKPCRWHSQRKPYGATTNNLPTWGRFSPFIQRNIIFNRAQQNMVKPCPVFAIKYKMNQIRIKPKSFNDSRVGNWKYSKMEKVRWASMRITLIWSVSSRNSSKCRLEQSFQSLSGKRYRYNFNNGILKVCCFLILQNLISIRKH
jgi:hypothetical protein